MSDYGSLYLIEANYNSERDATEVIFGYLEQEKEIKGRIMSIRVIVNIAGCKDKQSEVVEKGLIKAKKLLIKASKAAFEDS